MLVLCGHSRCHPQGLRATLCALGACLLWDQSCATASLSPWTPQLGVGAGVGMQPGVPALCSAAQPTSQAAKGACEALAQREALRANLSY